MTRANIPKTPIDEPRMREPVGARLVSALRTVWVYSLTGIAVGSVIVLVASRVGRVAARSDIATLLEHLGAAFIVAGIAVLFYEWSAHIKATLSLSEELRSIKGTVGTNALDGALRSLLRGEGALYDEELVASIKKFVEELRELQSRGDWAMPGYVRFLCRMQKDVLLNAENLRRISVDLADNPATETAYRIRVKSPGALTDVMLAEQMRRLPAAGRYSTASNPIAWHGNQLRELHEESQRAVERGVIIRRIFVLYKGLGPHGHDFDFAEADDIIHGHLSHAHDWRSTRDGRYEIRLFDAELRRRISDKGAADFILENHYGIFERPQTDHRVLVQVTASDLSNLTVTGLGDRSPHYLHWETVWNSLPEATPEVVDDVLARWRVRRDDSGA